MIGASNLQLKKTIQSNFITNRKWRNFYPYRVWELLSKLYKISGKMFKKKKKVYVSLHTFFLGRLLQYRIKIYLNHVLWLKEKEGSTTHLILLYGYIKIKWVKVWDFSVGIQKPRSSNYHHYDEFYHKDGLNFCILFVFF